MKKITMMMLSALAAISVRARESLNHENAKDYKQDFYLINKAAEQGDVNAQYDLGVMYAIGQGVSQDYKQAVAWYSKAAVQGDVGNPPIFRGIHK